MWYIGITIASSDKKEEAEKAQLIDWGRIYAKLLDLGLDYDEIPKRTFPQIQALLAGRDEIIATKMTIPNIFGAMGNSPILSPIPSPTTEKQESTQEEVEAFFNSF